MKKGKLTYEQTKRLDEMFSHFPKRENPFAKQEYNHEFGDQYETAQKDIYGKKCKKCGFVKFDVGEKVSKCGCRFINAYSNAIQLCEECSKLPCHNRGN